MTEEGEYSLTTISYVMLAVLIFLMIVVTAFIADRGKRITTRKIAFSSIAIALATVTSMIKFFDLPFGGTVTLFSMFFIVLIGYWYGPTSGILVGLAYGILQFLLGPYIVSLPQVLIDYPFAFGALGLSGFFSNKKNGLVIGYLVGIFGRFVFSVISGVVFFYMYAPEGMHPFVYSAAYNGTYIGVEGAITLMLIFALQKSGVLSQLTAIARDEGSSQPAPAKETKQ